MAGSCSTASTRCRPAAAAPTPSARRWARRAPTTRPAWPRGQATLEEAHALGLRDLDATESLRGAIDGTAIITVPAFAREPVELEGIAEVARELMP